MTKPAGALASSLLLLLSGENARRGHLRVVFIH